MKSAVLVVAALLFGAPVFAQPSASVNTVSRIYDGRRGSLDVEPPRIDQSIEVDGELNEAPWQQAAVLSGFSRYAPVDGAAADHATDVLVWYSPTAIHFGVRATATAGTVRATLADRDRIQSDDHIIIFLSTYNDSRQALVFGVNPLGVQLDGALAEGTRGGAVTSGRETPDYSPDFVFQSKGRVTGSGYEVELRIPFKSLRYQALPQQDWGIHVTRVVPQQGIEDSWAPARRDAASFLAQSGRLRNLTDLRRGLVLDLNPIATAKLDGHHPTAQTPRGGDPGQDRSSGWSYDASRPELGMNLRWGITPNLTMNGTVNPDFSQVESDAGQFSFDPRQALFFPEKRPFFLDGIEQFSTPNNLIYTRRIAAPLAAAKITGKVTARTNLAFLSAVDDAALSASGTDHPVFNILRVQRDVGAKSRASLVYTDRIDGDRSNRVIGSDARFVWKDIYSLALQGAVSRTATSDAVVSAPLWQANFARAGRHLAMRYQLRGVDPGFRAAAGFISRTGIANASFTNEVITYGRPGSALERWSGGILLDGTWQYDELMAGRSSQDRKLHFNNNFTFRGGWRASGSVLIETFGYDKLLYSNYFLGREGPQGIEFIPYPDGPRLPNLDFILSAVTPQRGGVEIDAFVLWGKDENFYEWASADIVFLNIGAAWKPTDKLRVDARYQLQSFRRRTDDSIVGIRRIPRVKAEYQISRPIFVRVVGEYNSDWQDDLRDDSRTNLPIYILNPATGAHERAAKTYLKSFRADWLFSYQPTPGTVLFAGYGNTLANIDEDPRRDRLQRTQDGFFLKLSYLFRL
jgi:hypothetical protein